VAAGDTSTPLSNQMSMQRHVCENYQNPNFRLQNLKSKIPNPKLKIQNLKPKIQNGI